MTPAVRANRIGADLPQPRTIPTVEHTTSSSLPAFDVALSGVGALAGGLLFWIIAVLIGGATSLWSRREKALFAASFPAFALLMSVVPGLGYLLAGVTGLTDGYLSLHVAAVVGVVWMLTVLLRRSGARAERLEGTMLARAGVTSA